MMRNFPSLNMVSMVTPDRYAYGWDEALEYAGKGTGASNVLPSDTPRNMLLATSSERLHIGQPAHRPFKVDSDGLNLGLL